MSLHLRFGLLGALLVGVGIIVLLLRSEPASVGDSTRQWDLLLAGLGVVFVAGAAGYLLALRRRRIVAGRAAGDEKTATTSFDLRDGLERLIGKRAGRIVNRVLFVLIGLVVVTLVGFLGYVLFIVLSEAL